MSFLLLKTKNFFDTLIDFPLKKKLEETRNLNNIRYLINADILHLNLSQHN